MKLSIEKMLTGGVVLLLSLLMYYLAGTQIQEASLAGVSPRAIPYLVAKCIFVLALIMIGQGALHFILDRRAGSGERSSVRYQAFPFILFGLCLLYALVMNYAGYVIASFTVLPAMMYVLRVRKPRNYMILAALVIFVFVVIDILLKIRLPKLGILGII